MAQTKSTLLVNHTFQGPRFADHGIDVDVLDEVTRYKNLLVETAKELWRRSNPDRERLPKNFEDSLQLKFFKVECNCATLPLFRQQVVDDQMAIYPPTDELNEAVALVAETIEAANADRPLPERFPRRLLSCFDDYGKSLAEDEWIELKPSNRSHPVRYDATARARLQRYSDNAYDDHVDLIGTVTMARVSKPRMAIQLSDGREVEAAFRPEDEQTITTALKDHATVKLRVIGKGHYAGDGQLQRVIDVVSVSTIVAGQPPFVSSVRPIWEQFEEIVGGVARDEMAKLPRDGAEHHDRYISRRSKAG